ncbi:MAG: SLC13 family permease [Planctomycetes bacterium]|nr:SLC13 family permease [Planctomycetota bacterium]MCP4771959.1 SLC13 family permease [Planctomycetota bacterium]MCP4860390.1 SLC13 family permease [Planctomycetota bacterium]
MTPHAWVTLAIMAIAAVLFITRIVRLEIVAMCIPISLYLTGALPNVPDVLSGFGNHAVIAIGAVFVLSAGIEESGVAAWMARGVQRAGGSSESRILALVCSAVAILSAFMSNAATVAVLLPVVISLARRAGIPASRLLMPLGYAAILGGNLTLIGTSSNLLVSDYLMRTTGTGLNMFEFAMVGIPICVVGILYLLTVGRKLVPTHSERRLGPGSVLPEQLVTDYGLVSNIVRLRIGRASDLIGKTLSDSGLGRDYKLAVLAVTRRGNFGDKWSMPSPDYVFKRGDELYMEGPEVEAWRLAEESHSRIGLAGEHSVEKFLDHGFALAEVSISSRSDMVGKSLRELDFRGTFGVSVISLWRDGKPVTHELADLPMQPGDAMLLAGPLNKVHDVERNSDLLMLSRPSETRDFSKAPFALLCLAVALVPPLAFDVPLAMSALLGAVLMIITGAVPADRAGRFMEWRVLAMIVGTIPLGLALERHGVANLVANAFGGIHDVLGVPGVLGGLYLISAVVSITSSNAAAAVIISPVAIMTAQNLGLGVSNTLLAVAFGCSCAFIVPFAHQCNLMVATPGGYRTKDFARVGAGLSLVVAVVAVALLTYL